MSVFVVDASVGMKWFVPELYHVDALRLQVATHTLHVPTLFDAEMGNILWKKHRAGELSKSEADAIMAQIPNLPVTRHSDLPILPNAFEIAVSTQRTVYDCLYLALAEQLKGKLVTGDRKFLNALSSTAWTHYMCWVEDVP
jgi:predicted nucleic acid-binding protein